ncbi:GNAT family N-acetyltransferase [Campylobacter sp. 2018MI13]|uniref:GNAT family N-acetyltransferase n=1 Tax=Campylobacter sp. 2018MI13 TaxID=2836737 RepID=UPI001BD9A703|nr:GNAT family N-acetyltransferase [Campylobacter sp. 2018MI13]MBT0883410.1 GNAT family N-acetyltransferase [Campylobacter sp. 2018MI13]
MIRPARMSDYKACEILDLAMAEFSENFFNETNYQKKIEKFYEFFGKEKTRFCLDNLFVYEKDNQIISICCAYGDREYNDDALKQYLKNINSNYEIIKECDKDEFYIDSVAIIPSYRKMGILKEMLEYAINIAKNKGYNKITLITKSSQIYERYGFKVINECKEFENYFKMLKEI